MTDKQLKTFKEHVASLMGLYQNNGAVSCVKIIFFFIWSVNFGRKQEDDLKDFVPEGHPNLDSQVNTN